MNCTTRRIRSLWRKKFFLVHQDTFVIYTHWALNTVFITHKTLAYLRSSTFQSDATNFMRSETTRGAFALIPENRKGTHGIGEFRKPEIAFATHIYRRNDRSNFLALYTYIIHTELEIEYRVQGGPHLHSYAHTHLYTSYYLGIVGSSTDGFRKDAAAAAPCATHPWEN